MIPRNAITDKQLAYVLSLGERRGLSEAVLDALLSARWPPGVTAKDLDSVTAGIVIDDLKAGRDLATGGEGGRRCR